MNRPTSEKPPAPDTGRNPEGDPKTQSAAGQDDAGSMGAPDGAGAPAASDQDAASPEPARPKSRQERSVPDQTAVLAEGEQEPPPRPPTAGHGWGLAALVAGAVAVTFILMSLDLTTRLGVPLGMLTTSLGGFGLVRLWSRAAPATDIPAVGAGSLILRLCGAGLAHAIAICLAVAGVLPLQRFSAAFAITTTSLWLSVEAFRLLQRMGTLAPAPIWRHHGFWLVAATTLLYLPMLGNFGLVDPWETHYGEVAREMLARDDWISLWWAQDGWFFTKPILNFWVQALSFKAFGVQFLPDQMVSGVLLGREPQPEWACRLPVFWMALGAGYLFYRSCIRPFGKRASLIGGLILVGTPYWLLLTRQTMADMPYVAPLTAACACLLLGFQTDPEERVRTHRLRFGRRVFDFNAYQVVAGVIASCALPQILYLLTRNVTLQWDVTFAGGMPSFGEHFGFRLHLDELLRGSGGGNCGLPGNKSCREVATAWPKLQPVYGALTWLLCAALFLWINRRETRTQRLWFLSAWFFTALAVMAKGAPGLVIPVATALIFPLVRGRFRDLLRLEWVGLLLLLLFVAMPWYAQMFARHGMPFIERLILHDMVKRAFAHVHDTNKGDDISFRYYIWQLGYGLFPWTGVAAGGLVYWLRKRAPGRSETEGNVFMLLWFLVAFGMFSITRTKFHHYILPLLPPVSAYAGVLMSRYLPNGLSSLRNRGLLYVGTLVAGTTLVLFGTFRMFPGTVSGVVSGVEPPGVLWLGVTCLLVGVVGIAAGIRWFGSASHPNEEVGTDAFEGAVLSVFALAAAISVGLAGRDMAVTLKGDIEGQIRLLHLFTYNYARPWPDTLDFKGMLAAFAICCSVAGALMAIVPIRHHMGVVFATTAGLWALWCCNVYLVQTEPHWGQRENILTYYRHRKDASEPFVAYQMNWKGENFYTGNKMATFVSSGKKFKRWVDKQRKRGVTTMFFTTEHSRIASLKRELEHRESFELLTTEADNNKFFVAKVELEPYAETPEEKEPKTREGRSASTRTDKAKGYVAKPRRLSTAVGKESVGPDE